MTRFGSRYTRDIAGIFDNAGSFLNGSAAFEDAVDFAGPGDASNSNIESAMRLRMMAAAKSGRLAEKNAIERRLFTLKSRRQIASRKLSLGSQSGIPNSERRLNARIEAWENPQQNQRRIDVMRRSLLQDQTVSQDALAKAQVKRLEDRFEEMPIVDLGPLRFTQGSQAGAWMQSLNGLGEETVVRAAQAISLSKMQAKKIAKARRKIVAKELRRAASSRGMNPSYFVRRYGNSFSPMDGFGAIQTVDEDTVSLPVAEFQQLLIDNGADTFRLLSSKTGKPDGIGGETTQLRAQTIGKKLGFEMVKVEFYENKRSARVTPAKFVFAMQGAPATAPADNVKSIKVPTKKVQEALLRLGSPSAGLVNRRGKPDGIYGNSTAAALAEQSKKNGLPLSNSKRSGSSTIIAPDTTWRALEKLSKSSPVDVGTSGQDVGTKDAQATLLVLGSSPVGLVSKKTGNPDGIAGSRTLAEIREQAARFGLPISKLKAKSGKKVVTIAPATTWHELANHASKAMEGKKATSESTPAVPGAQARSYASSVKVSELQQWLLNLGAPRAGLVGKVSGNPDGIWGKNTESALKKIAKGMGFTDVMVKVVEKNRRVMLSPPELQSALVEGSSGRGTTTVETSEETQLVEAKKEIAVKPARAELAKKVVKVVNAYIKRHKKPPRDRLSIVKQYQKAAGLKDDGRWGPATRTAVANDLVVAENSLPASAFEKKTVMPAKTVSVKDRANKAVNAVLAYIERKGRPPAIEIADVKSFQRAFMASDINSPLKKAMRRADGKYGPTTRGAIAAVLGADEKSLPVSAFDPGMKKVAPDGEDKIEEQVEKKKADEQEQQDKANGGTEEKPPPDTTPPDEPEVQEAGMMSVFKNPWVWGGVAALGLYLASRKSPGLPAGV